MKVGVAFGDHIKSGKRLKRYSDYDTPRPMRPLLLLLFLVIFPALIFLRLITIQIVHGGYYRTLSDSNRTKTTILFPQRGIIFDRNGTPLVYNNPNFESISGDKTTEITREEAMELMAGRQEELQIESRRYYPMKDAAAHILGYVGQISPEELSLSGYTDYSPEDSIGKSGIEQYYDSLLRGKKGKQLVEVDAIGREVRLLGETDSIPGQDITLTMDAWMQKTAFAALPDNKKGAVIVSTPDGEVLALVSKPSFDPNLFTLGDTYIATNSAYKSVQDILTDNYSQPLLNRGIGGVYPPGSTFKIVTAASGLEQKIIDANYKVEDTGVLQVGDFSFGNWYFLENGKKEGSVNVIKAISRSNDIFFYKLAEKITVDKLSLTAGQFGIGRQLGIDLPGEAKGILPTNEWKKKVIKEPWYLGDTYHYGIGQGYLLTTPLQVNNWTAAIANGGSLVVPHFLKSSKFNVQSSKFLSDSTINLIRQGMIDSCNPGGVAFPLFNFRVINPELKIDGKNFLVAKTGTDSASLKDYREVSVACKTGTAQHGGEDTPPHAWITLFAPAYNPEIVVTVLVESGGQGSNVAAPIAKRVLEEWFGR